MTQYFYVIYIQKKIIRDSLNLIKYICDPVTKHEAHITIRGPYKRTLAENDLQKFNAILNNKELIISGVGDFFESGQNTVFFNCESPVLKDVWDKPDYINSYAPHITIYDGKSREFAEKLFDIVMRYSYHLSFEAGTLSLLKSDDHSKMQRNLLVRSSLDLDLLSNLAGHNFSSDELKFLSIDGKLSLIDLIAQFLSGFSKIKVPDNFGAKSKVA